MDSLFRQSGLYREKWDNPHYADGRTYGEETIQRAICKCGNTYDTAIISVKDKPPPPAPSIDLSQLRNFRYTDVGNSERLYFLYGNIIRYCFAYKSWFIYDGKKWAIDKIGQIIEMAKATICETKNQAKGMKNGSLLNDWCRASESKAKINAMIDLAQSLCPVKPEDLDANIWLLNCQNGVIDLQTGQFYQHNPEFMLSKICNAEYQANLIPGLWHDTVKKIMPDDEMRSFIQRFAGYSLTGSIREEKFIVANGSGGNGKGTLIETLGAALGDYCETLAVEILLQTKNIGNGNEPSPELAKLAGIRFLMASETGKGRMLDEARVKAITGGDTITARRLRCDPFSFLPQFKLWLSTNHVPRIRGDDKGIWRRIRLVEFTQEFEGKNRENKLKEKLRKPENLAAALSWAVQGCLSWQREGLNEPIVVIQSTNNFREECDIIHQFINDECELNQKYEAPVKMFYHAFVIGVPIMATYLVVPQLLGR